MKLKKKNKSNKLSYMKNLIKNKQKIQLKSYKKNCNPKRKRLTNTKTNAK